jgi:hypothetical protein
MCCVCASCVVCVLRVCVHRVLCVLCMCVCAHLFAAVQVYNETIRDLLVGSDEALELREDPIKGPTVAGVSEVEALSTDEVRLC